MKFTSSIIIATYNWPQALEVCLSSLLKQKVLPEEIIIADDGSTSETKNVISKFKEHFKVPLVHVWHEDKGFQLSVIRNKAVAESKADYIIQVDGDLVLHRDFIKDHINAASQGYFIAGSRALIDKDLTSQILSGKPLPAMLLNSHVSNQLNTLHQPGISNILSKIFTSRNYKSIRGCNMSFWKKDFIAVNGYDEKYTGWGREDSDLVIRFFKYGLKRTYFKWRGVVYHLHHTEHDRANLITNDALLKQAMQQQSYRCEKGIDQYL